MGMEQRVADEIAHFFMFNFDIELEDSPQILDNYLYLEFWFNGKQIKIRMPYSISKDSFLRQGTLAREHILMKEVILGIKKI